MKKRIMNLILAAAAFVMMLAAAVPAHADMIDTLPEFVDAVPGLKQRLIVTGIILLTIAAGIVILVIIRRRNRNTQKEEDL